ncbi:MAG TPA: hypothetical protein VHW65_01905 [Gemmatimonadales bacterium]|nr:hypothetical protein [Gemmatimonadales bacterium]
MTRFVRLSGFLILLVVACRGAAPAVAQSTDQRQLAALVDSLMPAVAKATGLEFKSVPKSAIRTREQIRAYLVAKFAREMPPARLDGIANAYRLLGMLPDSLDVRQLFLDLYTEQIAGFYDPDSLTLFAVAGSDPAQLRLVLAHELVHALQHEYVPLDSILHDTTDADQLGAAQAMLEGQATLASMVALFPTADLINNDAFWDSFRDQLRQQQFGTTLFAKAPLVIREGLTFPYVSGAEFVRWFRKTHPGNEPFGGAMPRSTEQVLHTDRYARGDVPLEVRFAADTGITFEDTFGEFDIEVLRAIVQGTTDVRTDPAIGWGGDRLRVYRSAGGPALVWVIVWDEPRNAAWFASQVAAPLVLKGRPGYRTVVDSLMIGGKTATRVVVAPLGWNRWKSLPVAEIRHL